MNAEQQKYVDSLDYEFGGITGMDVQLTEPFKAKLQEVNTPAELVNLIAEANCFGVKDSVVVSLLG